MNVVYIIYWLDNENHIVEITLCENQQTAVDFVINHPSFKEIVEEYIERYAIKEEYYSQEEMKEKLINMLDDPEGISTYCYIDSETIIQ